jgi:hypothetical protein
MCKIYLSHVQSTFFCTYTLAAAVLRVLEAPVEILF